MTKIHVQTTHATLHTAWCEQPDCDWTYHGPRAAIRAHQHATGNGHTTTHERAKRMTYIPTNLIR